MMESESERVLQLLGALLIIFAVAAAALRGRQGAASVLASPFRLFEWMLRGTLSAIGQILLAILTGIGRGVRTVVSDAHRYLYRRWPGATLLAYAIVLLAFITWLYMSVR